MITDEVKVKKFDSLDRDDCAAIPSLINMFIEEDPDGSDGLLDKEEQQRLVNSLSLHPRAIVLLAKAGDDYAGILVAYENFSTFTALPMINIHDVFVHPDYRGRGVSRLLMDSIIAESEKKNCSRITLEVAHDNTAAKKLYESYGFASPEHELLFWRKYL